MAWIHLGRLGLHLYIYTVYDLVYFDFKWLTIIEVFSKFMIELS